MSLVPYSGPCNANDSLNTANNLCYVSGTYSPICNSGDTYVPNNNMCIIANSTSSAAGLSPYVLNGSTCAPGSILNGSMCYPSGTYPGICNLGDTSSSATVTSSGAPTRLYWCNVTQQLSDQDIYNNNMKSFMNLQGQATNAAVNCAVSYNVLIALMIPVIIILLFVIIYIALKYDIIAPLRNTNRP